jgi:hypothetical protein
LTGSPSASRIVAETDGSLSFCFITTLAAMLPP